MLHKNFTSKETLNWHNNIIFQVVLGEMRFKCINLKICGNKLLDAPNYMEKTNILVN